MRITALIINSGLQNAVLGQAHALQSNSEGGNRGQMAPPICALERHPCGSGTHVAAQLSDVPSGVTELELALPTVMFLLLQQQPCQSLPRLIL